MLVHFSRQWPIVRAYRRVIPTFHPSNKYKRQENCAEQGLAAHVLVDAVDDSAPEQSSSLFPLSQVSTFVLSD